MSDKNADVSKFIEKYFSNAEDNNKFMKELLPTIDKTFHDLLIEYWDVLIEMRDRNTVKPRPQFVQKNYVKDEIKMMSLSYDDGTILSVPLALAGVSFILDTSGFNRIIEEAKEENGGAFGFSGDFWKNK